MDDKSNPKVYSPDIHPYSMEGRSGIFGTLLSFVVAPIRITTRVIHNIFILPANLQEDYADALTTTSLVIGCIGIIDLFMYKKWCLTFSQIPTLYFAYVLKKQARKSTQIALEKREVDIDTEQVQTLCNTVFSELNEIIGSDSK